MNLKILSLVFVSLILTFGFYFTLSSIEGQKEQELKITAIAQTGPVKEGLKTDCLAEILSLSLDQQARLSLEKMKECFLALPLIENGEISMFDQETLYIDYELRSPIFYVLDLVNGALDKEGAIFPFSPYYTPKHLPSLFLGLERAPNWGERVEDQKIQMAVFFHALFGEKLLMVDLSRITEVSRGQRELTLKLQGEGKGVHLLRLTPRRYLSQLERYKKLIPEIKDQDYIIDLRIPSLAYLTPYQEEEGSGA